MVSKSETIRKMAREGMAVADIARSLGIRYQFAYNVLHAGKAEEIDRLENQRSPPLALKSRF